MRAFLTQIFIFAFDESVKGNEVKSIFVLILKYFSENFEKNFSERRRQNCGEIFCFLKISYAKWHHDE